MRIRILLAATACALTAAAVPAAAAPAPEQAQTGHAASARSGASTPVGGPLLSGRQPTVQPLPGMPKLPTGLSASAWLVADADTGAVLAAKAPHARYLPASTLKTLTAVTLIPRLDPRQKVEVTNRDAAVDGSKVGLVPGMSYTVDKLFTAMLVVSGNDAADALAEAAGGIHRTVRLMNAEARHLQANDTVARTPSGLDGPGESTSAYDLALVARAGLKLPAFRRYVGTVRGTVPAPHHKHFQIYTHNRLLTSYRGAIGVKNGYTVAAHATYVGAATRHGHTLIVTLLHADPYFWDEARALLDWGFRAMGHVTPVGTLVGPRQPVPAAVPAAAAAPSRATVALPPQHKPSVQVWQLVALATSAAVAAVVTTRRQRRRYRSR